jgi:hypothetical protein
MLLKDERILLRLFSGVILVLVVMSTNAKAEEQWCYEKDISYPSEMFGQFSHKLKTASKKFNRTFTHNKEKLSQRPAEMLKGLAYLEVLVNELCFDRHNMQGQSARRKIEDVVVNLRTTLGLPSEMTRTKIINIYWSMGRVLELAEVEEITIDGSRKKTIRELRSLKSSLKSALEDSFDND